MVPAQVTRPGRLDQLIHIPLPDRDSRLSVFKAALRKAPLDPAVDLAKLADFTEGFSGADITNLCRDAAMMPMRRAIKGLNREEIKNLPRDKADLPVSQADLEQALERIHSSVSSTDLERHQQWLAEFGSS